MYTCIYYLSTLTSRIAMSSYEESIDIVLVEIADRTKFCFEIPYTNIDKGTHHNIKPVWNQSWTNCQRDRLNPQDCDGIPPAGFHDGNFGGRLAVRAVASVCVRKKDSMECHFEG